MAKWGKVEFDELRRLADAFNQANDERVIERFIRDFLVEMGNRAMRKTKKRTPVGRDTPNPGNLRRSWKLTNVERRGNSYQIELYNDARYDGESYASFVEYGHRTGKDLTKWVEGRFMMTISMKEIERDLPKYLEKRMTELLDNLMNGRPPKKG